MLKKQSSTKDKKKSKGAGRQGWQAELRAQGVCPNTLALLSDLRERYGLR
jgi:hypothetical protein